MYKICKHCKKEIIPLSKAIVVIVKSGDIATGIHTPEGIFLEDEILQENYYHTECYQLKEGKQMNSRKAQSMADQELDRRKARAWDKLYEWAYGRTLVHVNVDLDDVEKRMDELLAQENAEHDD